jgi:hypothetical protein
VASDGVFVSHTISTATGSSFDDLVTWIATGTLYGQMVSSGRLP